MGTGRQTRTLLLVGFGGLLLLLAAIGLNSLSALRGLQTREEQIRNDYIQRSRILEQLRSDIYLSGTHVRDLLLEPDPARAEFYRTEFRQSQAEIGSLVKRYEQALRPEERSVLNHFRQELSAFFAGLAPAVAWDAEQRHRLGYAFMQAVLLPRRTMMIQLADQLERVNDRQLSESGRQFEHAFLNVRTRLTFLLCLLFSIGVTLAIFSFRRVVRLEQETAQQLAATIYARTALRDLSTRLVEVQENERKAISRELHDEIGQSLSGILLGMANLSAMFSPDAHSEVQREIQKLRRLTEKTFRNVRDMSLLLRPSMLDDLGLVPALQWQAREVSRNDGLDVTINAQSISDDLSDETKTCIYRIVQEALRNAVRHARATSVSISLVQDAGRLVLSVNDNGCGFDPEDQKGLGLLGMEERVRHLGGTFALTSASGNGASIQVELPYSADRELSPA
jgi:signal transduction histidine kinase